MISRAFLFPFAQKTLKLSTALSESNQERRRPLTPGCNISAFLNYIWQRLYFELEVSRYDISHDLLVVDIFFVWIVNRVI